MYSVSRYLQTSSRSSTAPSNALKVSFSVNKLESSLYLLIFGYILGCLCNWNSEVAGIGPDGSYISAVRKMDL